MQHKAFTDKILKYDSVVQLVDKYQLFLVDLWGVIHDGAELYDGVKNCLEELRAANKKIIFLSNAPKREKTTREILTKLGISSDLYDGVITSGEVAREYIISNKHDLGKKYFIFEEQESDLLFLENNEYKRVNSVSESDFILAIGFNRPNPSLEELKTTLCQSLRKNNPMICANPDLVIVDKKGNQSMCAGVMAKKYVKMGGKVLYFGKPHNEIYKKAFLMFPDIEKKNICAIGDNIETDIKGGNTLDIDTYLIAGGIHGYDLGIKHGEIPEYKRLLQLCDNYSVRPTGVLSSFVFTK